MQQLISNPHLRCSHEVRAFLGLDEERDEMLGLQPGASNTGPMADVVADWGGAYKVRPGRTTGDAPKAGQLKGDRVSLLESS